MIPDSTASLLALLLCSTLATGPAAAQDGLDLQPREVRVIWTEAPQTRAVVAWTTVGTHPRNDVLIRERIRTEGDAEPETRRVEAGHNGPYADRGDDDPELHYHHAEVLGLEPSTTYEFEVRTGDAESRTLYFTTAPDTATDFALLSGGDSRSDPATRRAMNRRIRAVAAARPDILAFAHGGDYVANGRDLSQWWQWLQDHTETTLEDGRVLPVIPTRGNHEGRGALYDQVWAKPGGTGTSNWFSTRVSPEVLLITLNSETAAGGDQRDFLGATLERHPDRRFKLVQYHRPLFPAVKSPGRAKGHWQPLFDAHGVDLVLESDGHVLKRTVPVSGDQRDDERGVVYIGEGGLGVGQRRADTDRWYLQEPGFAKAAHHVWIVAFDADGIDLTAVGLEGEVLDQHAMPARRPRQDD